MLKPRIRNISLLNFSIKSKRKIKVTFSDEHVVYIESCHESWQQYGSDNLHLQVSAPVADKFNNWLHGGNL